MKKNPKPIIIGPQLQPGHRYSVKNGGTFECLAVNGAGDALLQSITSGARFIASMITMYEDGTISWLKATDVKYGREPKMKALTKRSELGRGYSINSGDLTEAITKLGTIEHEAYYLLSAVCDERCKYSDLFDGMEGGQEKLETKCDSCPLDKLANLIWEGKKQ